jgi:hypothetical protein
MKHKERSSVVELPPTQEQTDSHRFRSLQGTGVTSFTCKIPECGKPTEGRTGLCSSHNRELRRIVKTPIAKTGDKLKKRLSAYAERKRVFLQNKRCAVYPVLPATEIHHMAGRTNDLLNDEKYWLPVSRKGHVEIELNPAWAKKQGFSVSRLSPPAA